MAYMNKKLINRRKQRRIRIIVLLLLMTSILMNLNGCIGRSIDDKMVDYMNEKYPDDHFEYKEPFGGGAGAESHQIIVRSENYPDKDIYVYYTVRDDNTEIYEDNYRGFVYEEQTKECLAEFMKECLDGEDFIMFYDVSTVFYFDDQPDGSFESFISSPTAGVVLFCVVNMEGKELDRQAFADRYKRLVEEKHVCFEKTRILFDEGTEAYNELEQDADISKYISRGRYTEYYTLMDAVGVYSCEEWRNQLIDGTGN